VIWGIFAFTVAVWFSAIFFIIRGWGDSPDGDLPEMAMEGVDNYRPEPAVSTIEMAPPTAESKAYEEIEITAAPPEPEAPPPPPAPKVEPEKPPVIEEPPAPEPVKPQEPETPPVVEKPVLPARPSVPEKPAEDLPPILRQAMAKEAPAPVVEEPAKKPDAVFDRIGMANVLEFPAEYVDGLHIKGINGEKITPVDFAKNCYREIGFKCIDFINSSADGKKVNIFDLVSSHYASTDDAFVEYFRKIKENFQHDIQSIASHPEITVTNKRALAGKYDGMPQLIAWNEEELFLVFVKNKDESLTGSDIKFFNEYALEKKLFKVKIFRVTSRGGKARPMEAEPVKIEQKEAGPAALQLRRKASKKPFTKEEIEFMKVNRGRMTNEELAEHLERSLDSVTHKLSRMNISRQSYEWTDDKDDFLKNNIAGLTYRELGERLGTTAPSVRARCKKLGIKK
jgi:hypothetical protein